MAVPTDISDKPLAAAAPPTGVTAPLPPPQSQQEVNDRWDAKIFGGGMDHITDSLDEGQKNDLEGMLTGVDDPAEAKASMVNQAYAARMTHMDPEELSQNWGVYRDHFASAVAESPMSGVSDKQLFGLIAKSIEKKQGEQQMIGQLQVEMLHDAAQGQQDYTPTLERMHAEMLANPNYDPKHEDQYLLAAKGAWAQIAPSVARISPVAQMVAAQFVSDAQKKEDLGGIEEGHDAAQKALMGLNPQERKLALAAATEIAGKKLTAAEAHGEAKKPGTGEMLTRGTADLLTGTMHTGMRLLSAEQTLGNIPGPRIGKEQLDELDLKRDMDYAYQEAYKPQGGRAMQAYYGFAKSLPMLASMAIDPVLGTALTLGQISDDSMAEFQERGMTQQQAFTAGLIAAAPAAAIMKIQEGILSGETMPWLAKFMKPSAKTSAALVGKTLGHMAIANVGILNIGQAAQDSFVPALQDITHRFDKSVPGVHWGDEFKRIGATRVDTFITLLPLAIVGTAAGGLRESAYMRAYMGSGIFMRAVGFTKEQIEKVQSAKTPAEKTALIQLAWKSIERTEQSVENKTSAMKQVDASHEAAYDKLFQPGGAGIKAADNVADQSRAMGVSAQLIADKNASPELFHVAQSGEAAEPKAEEALSQGLDQVEPGKVATMGEKVAEAIAESRKTGAVMKMPEGVTDWLGGAKNAVVQAFKEITADPKMDQFKEILNKLIGNMQRNVIATHKTVMKIRDAVPDKKDREGITNWIQADGDKMVLTERLKATDKADLKRGYERALNLTPEQIKVAKLIQQFYKDKLAELQKAGLVKEAAENYVNQVWKRDFAGGGDSAQFASKLQKNFKFGKERTFGTFFEGEQADYTPVTKDISTLMGIYLSEANKVIATREFLKEITTKDASDSTKEMRRPYAAPFGGGSISQSAEEGPSFIRPMQRSENTADYKIVDNAAMRGWKWLGLDSNEQPVMLEGQLAVHPEIERFVNAMLGRDKVRDWYNAPGTGLAKFIKSGLKAVDVGSSEVKGMMFTFSAYHQLQESVRALGERVNPFAGLKEIDENDPMVKRSTDAGLMLAGDHAAMRDYIEGYGSNNPFYKIPIAGDAANKYSHWFFQDYLPRLKQKTWEAVVGRNTDRYADKLASGEMKQKDVDYLSAQQVNATYGHLNYTDLGRSPTARHLARIAMLAPDFLESSGRSVGQALKSFAGNKSGHEQLQAIAFLALTQYLTARVMNETLDGDSHTEEPFGVVYKGRTYSIRSIPADIFDLIKRPRQFASGRLSPIVTAAWEVGSGKNYRGEQVSVTDSMRDVATNVLPMSLRPFLGKVASGALNSVGADELAKRWGKLGQGASNVPLWDQFITSQGLRISRNSDINTAFHLGQEYQKENAPKDQKPDSTVYPVSEYQQMRYALEDGDQEKAQAELDLIKQQNPQLKDEEKMVKGFKESLFRPFSGNKKTEADFIDGLDAKDKDTVEKAIDARSQVWSQFLTLNFGKSESTQ